MNALQPAVAPTRPAPPLWLALLVTAAAGPILDAAFPDKGFWPLAIPGTALMLWALRGRSAGAGLLLGAVGGFTFFGTHIWWLTVYLGPAPWIALTLVQTLFTALVGAVLAVAWRATERAWPTPLGRLGLVPVIIAGLWTLREGVASVWPFGGFAWGRLSLSQSEGWFGDLAAWLGASGLSFVISWLAALGVQLVLEGRVRGGIRISVGVAALVALVAVPAWPVAASGSMRVAAVQGNSDAGLFAEYTPGEILDDHLQGTVPLFGEDVDLVVWPENSADINPLRYERSAAVLDFVTRRMRAPLVVGAITQDGERTFNSMLLWREGRGPVDQYDKVHPVPFAEYLPYRDFFYPLAPDLFRLVPRDYTFGQRDNLFDVGGVLAGLAICYDIVDDDLIAAMIDGGAEVILAPTNNADFGRTDESAQQLAIARLRAIETGRSVVNISTVGTSAIIAPDGRDIDRLPTFEPGSMLQTVPLSDTITPASAMGRTLEWFVCLLAVAALGVALVTTRSPRRTRTRL